MTAFAYLINLFPWHGTRLRDEGYGFLLLLQRGNLNPARSTGPLWQHVLREAMRIQHERSSFSRIFTNDEVILAHLDA